MDFLNGKIKNIYLKYLAAAFGSALITSIYSIVDMAMVGSGGISRFSCSSSCLEYYL